MNEITKFKYELSRIYEHCNDIVNVCIRYNYDYNLITRDKLSYKACLMSIIQIGEHCVRLRDSENENIKLVPFPIKQIITMRNKVTHGYSQIDQEMFIHTIQYDIPELKEYIENEVLSEVLEDPYQLYDKEYEQLVK